MKNTTDSSLVRFWNDFIDQERRKEGEGGFVKSQLFQYNCKKVYDLALGTGFNSIEALLAGFDVISNEIDPDFVKLALKNADERKLSLKLTNYDWRELPSNPKFDAALMLGNSFIYLHEEKDRKKVLENVHNVLNEEGIFIIDQRNFDYILREKDEVLKGNFRYSGKYVYCGKDVIAYPVEISRENVKFEYLDKRTGKKYYIDHYPILEKEMLDLLRSAGFRDIKTFYDYKSKKPEDYDFVQHVAKK